MFLVLLCIKYTLSSAGAWRIIKPTFQQCFCNVPHISYYGLDIVLYHSVYISERCIYLKDNVVLWGGRFTPQDGANDQTQCPAFKFIRLNSVRYRNCLSQFRTLWFHHRVLKTITFKVGILLGENAIIGCILQISFKNMPDFKDCLFSHRKLLSGI